MRDDDDADADVDITLSNYLKCAFSFYLQVQRDQMFELKVAQLSPKVAQKVGAAIFSKKVTFFNSAQKATKYLGYLLKKICHKYLSKIAQSGCTDYVRAASFESSHIN